MLLGACVGFTEGNDLFLECGWVRYTTSASDGILLTRLLPEISAMQDSRAASPLHRGLAASTLPPSKTIKRQVVYRNCCRLSLNDLGNQLASDWPQPKT